jgi:hypothetical protein
VVQEHQNTQNVTSFTDIRRFLDSVEIDDTTIESILELELDEQIVPVAPTREPTGDQVSTIISQNYFPRNFRPAAILRKGATMNRIHRIFTHSFPKKNHLMIPLVFFPMLFLVLLVGGNPAFAEGVEITPFLGYQIGGSLTTYGGEFRISDNENYGIAIDVPLKGQAEGFYLELLYLREDSDLRYKEWPNGLWRSVSDLTVEYYQVGALVERAAGSKVTPFGSMTMGTAYFDPQVPGYHVEWLFAWTLGGGVKVNLSDRLGLRFQARLLMPIDIVGGSIFCSGGGCSWGVAGYSAMIQGDFTAGVVIKLGRVEESGSSRP